MDTTRPQSIILASLPPKIIDSSMQSDCVPDMLNMLGGLLTIALAPTIKGYEAFKSTSPQSTTADKHRFLAQTLVSLFDVLLTKQHPSRCDALTAKKSQCKRSAHSTQFCRMHQRMLYAGKTLETVSNSAHLVVPSQLLDPCCGTTKKGKPCRRLAKATFCHSHKAAPVASVPVSVPVSPPVSVPVSVSPSAAPSPSVPSAANTTVPASVPLSDEDRAWEQAKGMVARYCVFAEGKHPRSGTGAAFEEEHERLRVMYTSRLNSLSCYLNDLSEIDLDIFDEDTESFAAEIREDIAARISLRRR